MKRLAPLLAMAACGGASTTPALPAVPSPVVAAAPPPDAAEADHRYCDSLFGLVAAAPDGFRNLYGDGADPDSTVFASVIEIPDGDCVISPYEDVAFVRCDMMVSDDRDEVQRVYGAVGVEVTACFDPSEWTRTDESSRFTLTGPDGNRVAVAADSNGAGTYRVRIYVYAI